MYEINGIFVKNYLFEFFTFFFLIIIIFFKLLFFIIFNLKKIKNKKFKFYLIIINEIVFISLRSKIKINFIN